MAESHLIEDLAFEVELEPSSQLAESQDRLRVFAQGAALRIIDEVFDELTLRGTSLRLEQLEIDLGRVDADAMESLWESRLRERLLRALTDAQSQAQARVQAGAQRDPVAPASERESAEVDALMHFLHHGRFAWHAGAALDPVALAASVIGHSPALLLERLRQDPRPTRWLRRLIEQMPSTWLVQLASRLAPGADRESVISAHERAIGPRWSVRLESRWLAALRASGPALRADDFALPLHSSQPDAAPRATQQTLPDGRLLARRSRFEAALLAAGGQLPAPGTGPGTDLMALRPVWHQLLRDDRPWLVHRLQQLGSSAALRRWIASQWPEDWLEELMGLWLDAPGREAMAKALAAADLPARAAPPFEASVTLLAPSLRAPSGTASTDGAAKHRQRRRRQVWALALRGVWAPARSTGFDVVAFREAALRELARDLAPVHREATAAAAAAEAPAPIDVSTAGPDRASALSSVNPLPLSRALREPAGTALPRRFIVDQATPEGLAESLCTWLPQADAALLAMWVNGPLPTSLAKEGGAAAKLPTRLRRHWCLEALAALGPSGASAATLGALLWRSMARHIGLSPDAMQAALHADAAADPPSRSWLLALTGGTLRSEGAASGSASASSNALVAAPGVDALSRADNEKRRSSSPLSRRAGDGDSNQPSRSIESPHQAVAAPGALSLAMRRSRWTAALVNGAGASFAEDWAVVLREDRDSLREALTELLASRALRHELAHRFTASMWVELLELFLPAADANTLAAALRLLSAAAGPVQDDQAPVQAIELREQTLAALRWSPAPELGDLLSLILHRAARLSEGSPAALARAAAVVEGDAASFTSASALPASVVARARVALARWADAEDARDGAIAAEGAHPGTELTAAADALQTDRRTASGHVAGPRASLHESPPASLPERPPPEMPGLLRFLRDTAPASPDERVRHRKALLEAAASTSGDGRRALLIALESPAAARRLVDLVEGPALHPVLVGLRREDASRLAPLLRELHAAAVQAALESQVFATAQTSLAASSPVERGSDRSTAWPAPESGSTPPIRPDAAFEGPQRRGDRLLIRELFEEDRPLDEAGLAGRWIAAVAAPLADPLRSIWQRALAAALDRLGIAAGEPGALGSPAMPGEEPFTDEPDGAIYVANAGLVLAAPYLPRLFEMLGLVAEGAFVDADTLQRAVLLSQYVVTGASVSPESLLVLNKLLCGMPLQAPMPRDVGLGEAERAAADGMLQAMIEHWRALGQTSVAGLRESFLQRTGRLEHQDEAWQLQVEPRAFDMLLDRLPWGYATIKFSWMPEVLHVDWR